MKKFHVKDEDGEVFEVEELDEAAPTSATDPEPESKPEVNDDNGLSEDEISALKGLAAIAPKLMKLVEGTEDTCAEDEEELDDECEEPKVDDKDEQIEEVIDTDEETKPRDSKKSFGAIERKKKSHDSINNSLDVESAWAKRYGGNK